ncbi:pyruvate dehydrogenase E2 component (dihydrolipoamide acetyltransferase) [Tistlia consotensis]|uniref:Dihydrolipoamide acetyltransferase component of pyruvate dehydrogenase complex n=1 Tax=Tistlia consotensis USBA 355 TaxID=560819 RepID=A0A1Y6CP10_9PROT|nr:dihydrolipoamide acetyltransferase family protein [Tistlia consotensis]SMF80994.1 pyruvate dehydrogenase E2 component (dihydrolipoamide acetyltransferase) [Tistlia consotensis USBA 355]SNS22285.1 pyruvate dehydrogenase E2 component (dihydrolipoamide acetyltransferase) [Tistlia consotensis]
MADILMPSLGADMESGRLAEWLIKPGDSVAHGDVIAVVETQKGAIEIEAFDSGRVASLEIAEGEEVPVGTVIARLGAPGEATAAAPASAPSAPPPAAPAPAPSAPAPTPVAAPSPAPAGPRRRVSPAARRLAETLGVDLAGVEGRGPQGAVVSSDVRRAAETTRAAAPAATQQPARRRGLDLEEMRKAIAAAMARSKREIPHYYLATRVDLQAASDWLARRNAERPPEARLLISVLFLKATALALRDHGAFNGTYEEGAFRPGSGVHVGSAVAIRGGGLIAPAIHEVDHLDLDALMAKLRDLVERVRRGGLRSSELTDPTITVSSLGERGVESLFGVIYPPQVALLGFGRVSDQVVALDGAPAVRPTVELSLAADHRVTDGHRGGLFLRRIADLLQEPEQL